MDPETNSDRWVNQLDIKAHSGHLGLHTGGKTLGWLCPFLYLQSTPSACTQHVGRHLFLLGLKRMN